MDEHQIKQAIQTIARQEVSDNMDLWPMIQSGLEAPRRQRPALRLGRLAAALLILLVAGAAVYAVDRLLQTGDPGLDALQNANLVTELGLTQTQNGISVTLEYAYADANRISIVYTGSAQVPPTDQVMAGNARLTDDQGHTFRPMFGGGGGGGGGGGEGTAEATPETSVVTFGGTMSYDASVIEATPEHVTLHLELDAQHYSGQPAAPGTTPESGAAMTGHITGPDGNPVMLVYSPVGSPVTFVFDFTVPLNPGHVLNTPQTATASGIEMILKKLVVTPSMTRAVICFEPPQATEIGMWTPDVTISINGAEAMPLTALNHTDGEVEPSCSPYQIPQAPLLDSSNADWTLTITRLRLPGSEDQAKVNAELEKNGIQLIPQPQGGFGLSSPEGMTYDEFSRLIEAITAQFQKKIEGPWTFRFTLP